MSASALGLETGVSYGLVPLRSPVGVAVEGGLSLLQLSFAASPAAKADAQSFTDWSLLGSARLRGASQQSDSQGDCVDFFHSVFP